VQKYKLINCAYIVHQNIIRDGTLCNTQERGESEVSI